MIPATPKELKSLKGIIYGILNKRNGRWYIGQTKRTFRRRYWCKTAWWEMTHNTYLKRAVGKYGESNFEIYILEHSVKTNKELNQLEECYIKQYNSLYPYGYNFSTGGDSKEWSETAERKKAKTYTLKDKDDNLVIVTNGNKFCRDNNINTGDFWRMLKGDQITAGGYRLPNTDISMCRRSPDNIKGYICLKHRNGEIVKVYNVTEFAKQHNLNVSSLSAVVSGRYKRCGDWFLPETDVNFRQRLPMKKWKNLLLEKEGQEFIVGNALVFAKENNFHSSCLSDLVKKFGTVNKRGKNYSVKGFILKSVVWV